MSPMRILFVCTANRDRSPTAEDLYAGDPRYEARSAGTWQYAVTPLTRELLLWADRVFVLCESQDRHRTLVEERFPDVSRPIVDLDLPDRKDWCRGHPGLVRVLLERLEPHLGWPAGIDRSEGAAASGPVRPGTGTWDVRGITRLLAVGDVQSNYEPFARLLEAAGFLTWTGDEPVWGAGPATLLLLGDLLDGGLQPAEVLWLVRSLDDQARAAGGQLILLRGNHEEMLLESLQEGGPQGLNQWFANGGLETLARLASGRGFAVPESVRAAIFTPTFGQLGAETPEVQELLAFVREQYAAEIDFVRTRARAGALVNGCLLAVHGSPNFEAESWAAFSASERDDHRIAWGREFVRGGRASVGEPFLVERLRGLKARLDDERAGISIRHVLFAHTELDQLAIPSFGRRQFRIGRVVAPATDVPAAYDLMTVPRSIAPGGALGGLEFTREAVVAIYSREIDDGERRFSAREVLAAGEPLFGSSRA